MQPEIYWIKDFKAGHLAIMPKPRANDWLDVEINGLHQEGVDILVSLLTIGEVYELGLKEENDICCTYDIEFISFPIVDRQVPSSVTKTVQLSQSLWTQMKNGKKVAIHCRAGIGRSALIVASILVCAGMSPEKAYEMVTKSRGLVVPDTDEQRQWLYTFVQSLVGISF
ncbi:dual specificity protein phosphatase family protein [Candidatus Parabeggiatoa sp. HSG14]|uniref:protein-tyrosine phosphatase family protein n=1 Tax=Candidatus Parabeggiatoa sp. HSG14 TaxID=3055593 RepID=UPI0025A7455F|nr:dual specificity protein phosphatase family protein [Thiotrichales bacterium HSG14]